MIIQIRTVERQKKNPPQSSPEFSQFRFPHAGVIYMGWGDMQGQTIYLTKHTIWPYNLF